MGFFDLCGPQIPSKNRNLYFQKAVGKVPLLGLMVDLIQYALFNSKVIILHR